MSDDTSSENKMAHYWEALKTNAHVCWLILLFVSTVAAPGTQTSRAEETRKRRLAVDFCGNVSSLLET